MLKNYELGALKRKLGIKSGKLRPGDMIAKMNEQKLKEADRLIQPDKTNRKLNQKDTLAFKALV